ncbi:MAG: hypothetical protein E7351_01620 [Clostridiales bacterium]|nr:hypothetical protein [Clostridiales bacterium]
MCWNVKGWIYKRAYYGYQTKFERKHPLIIHGIITTILLILAIGGFIQTYYIAGGILLLLHFANLWWFLDDFIKYREVCKGKKEHKLLESYYFCNEDLNYIRKKYFKFLKELIDIQSCFCDNENLSEDERLEKAGNITDKLYKYLTTNKTAKREFEKAYSIDIQPELCDIVLQSIMADFVIWHKQYLLDIFLSKRSVLYFDNEYPSNYKFFKDGKDKNVLDYIKFIKKIEDGLEEYFEEKK